MSLLYSMLRKEIMEWIRQVNRHFHRPHPMVYMHFRRPFTLLVHIMLAQRQLWGNGGSVDAKWNRKRVVNADTGKKMG